MTFIVIVDQMPNDNNIYKKAPNLPENEQWVWLLLLKFYMKINQKSYFFNFSASSTRSFMATWGGTLFILLVISKMCCGQPGTIKMKSDQLSSLNQIMVKE